MGKRVRPRRAEDDTLRMQAVRTGRSGEFAGLFLIALGVLSFISLLGLNVGFIGRILDTSLRYAFGVGAYMAAAFIVFSGFLYIARKGKKLLTPRLAGILLLYAVSLGLYHHFTVPIGEEILPEHLADGGGFFGGFFLFILRKCLGVDGTLVLLATFAVGGLLLSTTWSLAAGLSATKRRTVSGARAAKKTLSATYEKVREADLLQPEETEAQGSRLLQGTSPPSIPSKKAAVPQNAGSPEHGVAQRNHELTGSRQKEENHAVKCALTQESEEIAPFPVQCAFFDEADGDMENTLPLDTAEVQAALKKSGSETAAMLQAEGAPKENAALSACVTVVPQEYVVPRAEDILQKGEKKANPKMKKEIAENAAILEETLENFRVKARIVNACRGPAVTRYELEPAPGVKVSKIVNLADDLALSLAASGIRIEAPIPGKAAVGVEVPNKELRGVHLREVLEQPEFQAAPSKLTVGLGMDISGKAILADIARMPHVLVAGATGSGKSVCINTLITSILFKAKPDEVKFILIDPKMVELSNYNGIPHLMVPVVTDAMKASSVLRWAVQEMEKRYAKFAAAGVRDMERYNLAQEDGARKLPSIVIIIDELADLMMVAAKDVEDSICRLAQKARAAGLHLVLATQRPSVDIITGVIKANIPSRISFAVSSQIDSRTILDATGAEKLLGRGDMLYYPGGAPKPMRIQGAFISDEEVESLIMYVKRQGEPEENEEIITFTENDEKVQAIPPRAVGESGEKTRAASRSGRMRVRSASRA